MVKDEKSIMLINPEKIHYYLDAMERYLDERDKSRKRDALDVFNAFLACDFENPKLEVVVNKDENGVVKIYDPIQDNLRKKIKSLLNEHTMPFFIDLVVENAESAKQTAAALKRHAENHAMKQEVFLWLDENMKNFTSMDGAATAIASKIVPVAWRTARDWVGQWKKLRSASKA